MIKQTIFSILVAASVIASVTFADNERGNGEAIYKARCGACHGFQGEGAFGPKLNEYEVEDLVNLLEAYRAGEIETETSSIMERQSLMLSADEVFEVSTYIYSM